VYVTASIAALAAIPFRPAHWALFPVLARNPGELVAANVSSSTIESLGALLGPALGGVVLAVWSPIGEQAIELATQHAPDLVLMDIQLAGMDGLRGGVQRLHAIPEG
jgi:two-component system sensor histidine kinase BarA